MRGRLRAVDATADAQVSAEEAATLLGLSRYRVYRQLADGVIPSRKVGRKYVIFRADLARLSGEVESSTADGALRLSDLIGLEIEIEVTGLKLRVVGLGQRAERQSLETRRQAR